MDTRPGSAHRLRLRLLDELVAIDAAEHELAEAEIARERVAAELKRVQAEYRIADAYAKNIRERVDSGRDGIRRLRKSLRTMATFPAELLGIIFANTISMRDLDDIYLDWDAALLPYRVAAVCRHWRTAALADPSCWTYLVLPPIPHMTVGKTAALLAHVERVISRSRSRLLDVAVSVNWDPTQKIRDVYAEDGLYSRLFASLMEQLRRIRSLDIHTASCSDNFLKSSHSDMSDPILKHIADLLCCPTPQLVHLSLSCAHTHYMTGQQFWLGYEEGYYPFFLPNAPKLATLSLTNTPMLCKRPHPVGLPLLRTLIIDCSKWVYSALIWDTVSMAPQLDKLRLCCNPQGVAAHPEQRPTSLPITELAVGMDSYLPLPETQLPNLRSLVVEAWKLDASDSGPPGNLGLTLTTLVVESISSFSADTIQTLRHFKVLEHATLYGDYDDVDDDRQLFSALCDAADPMWPRLRHLVLRGMEIKSSDRDGLLRLVRARNLSKEQSGLTRPLEKVEFDLTSVPGWVATQVKEVMGDDACVVEMPKMYLTRG